MNSEQRYREKTAAGTARPRDLAIITQRKTPLALKLTGPGTLMSTRLAANRNQMMTPIVATDEGVSQRRNAQSYTGNYLKHNKIQVQQNFDTSITEGGDSVHVMETKLRGKSPKNAHH